MSNLTDISPNAATTLSFAQIRGLVMEGVERTLSTLGYDKYVHRAELERSTGWSRRKVDGYIHSGRLTVQKRTDIKSNKQWFLRTDVTQIIDENR